MNRKRGKITFDEFQREQAEKRQKKGLGSHVVPEELIVQRMTANPTGRLKKYEPMDTREFVSFQGFYELSLENIKSACENHYHQGKGSCDVLVGDRGPSCTRIDQIKGKKVYLVRFLDKKLNSATITSRTPSSTSLSHSSSVSGSSSRIRTPMVSQFAKSISIADLIKAGKVQKEQKVKTLTLHYFDLVASAWRKFEEISVKIDESKFSEGGFREAFKAIEVQSGKIWVVKKYLDKSKDTIKNIIGISFEEHAKKQCQMHTVARNVAQRLSKHAPEEFGHTFHYNRVYFSILDEEPITIEEHIDGQFVKYINNDGFSAYPPENCDEDVKSIYEKAGTLVHFSLHVSEGKFMITDIQGSAYDLYDPEIATTNLTDDNDGEFLFCAGNLAINAITTFKADHKCNAFCKLLQLEPFFDNNE